MFALGRRLASHLGAADADRRHRSANHHLFRAARRDLARDEHEHPLQHRKRRTARPGVGVVDQLVEHHARIGAERERGVVGEHQPHRRACPGLQNVALEDGRIGRQCDLSSVDAGRGDRAVRRRHPADRRRLGHRRRLGILARRQRPGELRNQIGRKNRAALGRQRRRMIEREVVLDENLGPVGPDEQQVRALAHEVGDQQQRAVGNHHRRARFGLQDNHRAGGFRKTHTVTQDERMP